MFRYEKDVGRQTEELGGCQNIRGQKNEAVLVSSIYNYIHVLDLGPRPQRVDLWDIVLILSIVQEVPHRVGAFVDNPNNKHPTKDLHPSR